MAETPLRRLQIIEKYRLKVSALWSLSAATARPKRLKFQFKVPPGAEPLAADHAKQLKIMGEPSEKRGNPPPLRFLLPRPEGHINSGAEF